MSRGKDYRFLKSTLGRLAGDGLLQGDDDKLERGVEYTFLTGIVNDVISNPYQYMRQKVDADETVTVGELLSGRKKVNDINIGISNKELVDTAPMNSIIAQIIDPGRSGIDGELPVLCYPFFPPHLSLPLKPGEYVWLIECDVKGSKMYYWMCRQVGTIHVDDLNHTNLERLIKTSAAQDSFFESSGARDVSTELLDDAVSLDRAADLSNSSTSFPGIYANSSAYRSEFTGEPVPRLAKDCADLLLQGSNNTGIHLTTEKFSNIEALDLKSSKYSGKVSENDSLPTRKPDAAAIDIFVKRKRASLDQLAESPGSAEKLESINTVKNNCSEEIYTYLENDKMAGLRYKDDTVFDRELVDDGNDTIDVGARLYLSHKCDVDNTFLINFSNLADNAKMGPSIITFAQHNRVVGDQDVRLVSRTGQSYVDLDEKGNIILKASKGGAYISIRTDGSIAIVPGANGLLYLGGEPAEAINIPLGNIGAGPALPGTVLGIPIVTTMGGVAGQEGPTGNFASKVMFK